MYSKCIRDSPLRSETIEVLREQLEDQHATFLKDKDSVKRRCDELRAHAEHELDALFNDLRALAACAVSTRTGRTMEAEEVETQLNALKRKEEDVAQLRLQYIKLKNRYTKEDEALRSKVRYTVSKDQWRTQGRGGGGSFPPPKPRKICKGWGTTQASASN